MRRKEVRGRPSGRFRAIGPWIFATFMTVVSGAQEPSSPSPAPRLVPFQGQSVPADDLYKYERGYRPHSRLGWVRAKDVIAIEKGWPRIDLDYLSPDDRKRLDRGLFRCGPFWFDEADADDYHSRLLRWWRIPHEGFVAFSTCSRETTLLALRWMAWTRRDLLRIFGLEPALPSTVILLRSLVQYNAFAITHPTPEEVPPESSGNSAFHFAFPCEQWLDLAADGEHPEAACAYWDASTPTGNAWGPLAVRHAAAQAFISGLDPSPRAIRAYRADSKRGFSPLAYWSEKRIPMWLRYGSAVYCERFFLQDDAARPDWARAWSFKEIADQGGVGDLEAIFRCRIGPEDPRTSARTILRTGLLVAFMLDGGAADVTEAHEAFKAALKRGEASEIGAAVAALEMSMRARKAELLRFAKPGAEK